MIKLRTAVFILGFIYVLLLMLTNIAKYDNDNKYSVFKHVANNIIIFIILLFLAYITYGGD